MAQAQLIGSAHLQYKSKLRFTDLSQESALHAWLGLHIDTSLGCSSHRTKSSRQLTVRISNTVEQ